MPSGWDIICSCLHTQTEIFAFLVSQASWPSDWKLSVDSPDLQSASCSSWNWSASTTMWADPLTGFSLYVHASYWFCFTVNNAVLLHMLCKEDLKQCWTNNLPIWSSLNSHFLKIQQSQLNHEWLAAGPVVTALECYLLWYLRSTGLLVHSAQNQSTGSQLALDPL